jgi:tetratricopeptide (TPR) repeat protein
VLAVGRPQDIAGKAVGHLNLAVTQNPDDVRANTLLAEALLRTNQHKEALEALERAKAQESASPWTRNLYARALRAVGRYSDSADQYLWLLERQGPDSWAMHRQAVGVLRLADRAEEASRVFKEMMDERSSGLSDSFHDALAELPDKLDEAPVRQACLDWAWQLRSDKKDMDRETWERRARWGVMADQLILDWLECRGDQPEETMSILTDLEGVENCFNPLLAEGRGLIIATAHVGPMFAGPLILELLGIPSRWVSTAPRADHAHYAVSLISTSDQTDSQVARACLKAIQSNYAVAIAVDSSNRLGAPTTRFAGQDITYTDFAARLSHRTRAPSVFYAAHWQGERIGSTLKLLPSPGSGEDLAPFLARWREAYLEYLREHLGGPPENLRLSGGLWGAIRSGA